MRHALLIFAILAMTGCQFKTFELEPEWLPLEKISERPDFLAKDTIITTIGNTIYVENLEKFWERNPEGSPDFLGLLKHEREHSKRQFKKGVIVWLAQYGADKGFMWEEEQVGWYYELTEPGFHYFPENVAKKLSNYKNAIGQRMVDYDDALEWVLQVRAGTWTPPSD